MASKLLCLLVIACLAVSVLSLTVENNNNKNNTFPNLRKVFNNWKQNHGRSYESVEEEEKRFAVFRANLKFIREHNRKNAGFRMGLNEFSDLSNKEFRARMNGLKPDLAAHAAHPNVFVRDPTVTPPASKDWRQEGAVTGVKNQGQCGGCWSFSTTGSIEGAWAIAGNQLIGLSEQNLLDCSTNGGNDGCQGGLMTAAFEYVISNEGIDTENSYPYQAEGPLTCRYKASNKGASIDSYGTVSQGSESDLEAAAGSIGPISVAIDASHPSFQSYQSGVYYEPACSSTNLDHGVLVVGYGSTGGQDYWIVKNSWGTTWGIQGYIWMSRNRNNNCGIATMASYPIIKGGSGASTGGSGGSGGSSSGGYSSSTGYSN